MEKYITSLKDQVLLLIQEVESMECNMLQKSKLIIPELEKIFDQLKTFISKYTFKDQAEEIRFFKEIKPQLFRHLVYYSKIFAIEMRMPAGSVEDRKIYLELALSRIRYFFDMNLDFYQYCRSGSTHMDHLYFIRGNPDIFLHFGSFYFERDGNFSTCYDFIMTKILANEMLSNYLINELIKLRMNENSNNEIQFIGSNEKWTDSKNALVEIIYGIDTLGSVNHGTADLKVLASLLGKIFNFDLKNIYQAYSDIRKRKGDRTEYLNRMVRALNKRMDEDDNKEK